MVALVVVLVREELKLKLLVELVVVREQGLGEDVLPENCSSSVRSNLRFIARLRLTSRFGLPHLS